MKVFPIKLNNIFYKFLLCFFTIVLLLAISHIFFYRSSYNFIKKSIIDIKLYETSRYALDMDRNMYDIYKTIYYLGNNEDLAGADIKTSNMYFYFKKIQDAIMQSVAANPFIEDMVFYHENSDTIITSEGTYQFDSYFDNNLINEDYNKFFWKDYFNKYYKTKIFPATEYSSKTFTGETYSRELIGIVAERPVLPNIRILILAKANQISEQYGTDFIIMGEDGELIFNNSKEEINTQQLLDNLSNRDTTKSRIVRLKKNLYTFYKRSQNYPWYYIKVMPQQNVFSTINQFNIISLALIFIILLISIGLSYYFSNRLYQPIKKVVNFITPAAGEHEKNKADVNEMQKIQNHIQHIYDNYEYVERKYSVMQKIYKEYFYEKIINDVNILEDKEILKDININPEDFNKYIVIYFHVGYLSQFKELSQTDQKQYDKVSVAIKELMDITLEGMNLKTYSFEIKHNYYIVLVTLNEKDFHTKEFETKINKLLINDLEHLYMIFSYSKVHWGLEQLKDAYDEALNLFEYHTLGGGLQFISYESLTLDKDYIIPNNILEKFDVLIEMGKVDGLKHTFFELLKKFLEKEVPLLYIKKNITTIFNRIIANMNKDAQVDAMDRIYKEIDACLMKEDFDQVVQSIITFISNHIEVSKNEYTNQPVIDSMIRYIQSNYFEDICLDFFAEQFKMSSIYLSKLFKDYAGMNFSEFLLQTRMERARELLEESSLKIKDLAIEVGYKDANTFIKVFKKYFGTTPGQYRKKIASNKLHL